MAGGAQLCCTHSSLLCEATSKLWGQTSRDNLALGICLKRKKRKQNRREKPAVSCCAPRGWEQPSSLCSRQLEESFQQLSLGKSSSPWINRLTWLTLEKQGLWWLGELLWKSRATALPLLPVTVLTAMGFQLLVLFWRFEVLVWFFFCCCRTSPE